MKIQKFFKSRLVRIAEFDSIQPRPHPFNTDTATNRADYVYGMAVDILNEYEYDLDSVKYLIKKYEEYTCDYYCSNLEFIHHRYNSQFVCLYTLIVLTPIKMAVLLPDTYFYQNVIVL